MAPSRLLLSIAFLWLAFFAAPRAPAQLVPADTTEGRTTIVYENDPFLNISAGEGGAGFIKFAIILSSPSTVYFQDSNLYPFHYQFASQRLAPFIGFSPAQFDAVALRRSGQQVVLGAIIIPPFGSAREYGIQFVGLDAYPKEDVKTWFETVKSVVAADPAASAVYVPSFEQKAAAEAERDYFTAQGIAVDGIERWITAQSVYAEGWAFGRLVYVAGAEIAAAYLAGTLKPTDILLTDGVPAEVPFVAGILSQSAATPNSHVAILARNQRIPFAWINSATEQTRLLSLVGREVLLRVAIHGAAPLQVSAADEDLDPAVRAQILQKKQPPVVAIKARKHLGALSANTATLTPRSIKFFGGKASNFGLLRRTIPDNSPPAIAFSFDLWEQFLGNVNPESGLTLSAEIEQRLGGFTWPPNISEAAIALDGVRNLIRKKVQFTDGQKAAVLNALTSGGFRADRMLRFRSSSNAEDTAQFSGAGLYESFNGCIGDSQDGNDAGPSVCCSDEPEEKTVLKAIEKVFASFYNENAWLERLRFGINESQVGMAVLVHENVADSDEFANGVATVSWRPGFQAGQPEIQFNLVTQLGAVSVTNPVGGTRSEVVVGGQSGFLNEPYLYTQQRSDLVPLGGNVMFWEDDYTALTALLVKVAKGYAEFFPEKKKFTLDLEFKKLRGSRNSLRAFAPQEQPGVLQIKQVRELAEPGAQLVTPLLLNERLPLMVLQTESGDAFAYHRLKCAFVADTLNTKLNAGALNAPLYRDATFDFLLGDTPSHLENGPRAWRAYRFAAPRLGRQQDFWRAGSQADRVTFRLKTSIPTEVNATLSPVITQRDFTHTLTAYYATPQIFLDGPTPGKRSSDSARLVPRDTLPPQAKLQTRRIETPGGVKIAPEFYWPEYPVNLIIKTFPLAAWKQTTITGLTAAPLVLTDDFAQTYAPTHHNFSEDFLFEPALDPGLSTAQKAELVTADIRYIHVRHDIAVGEGTTVQVIGFDGTFRAVP